jgi:hypothetical protein
VTTPIDRLRALAMFDFPPSDELCAVPGVGPLDPAVILLGLNGEDLIAGFDPAGAGWWGLYVAEERVAEEHAAEEHDPAAPAGRTVVVSTWVYARHDPERLLAFAGGHAPTREALTHAARTGCGRRRPRCGRWRAPISRRRGCRRLACACRGSTCKREAPMARDRFVWFDAPAPTATAPAADDLGDYLRLYVSDGGTVEWSRDRWMVTLPGTPRDLAGRLGPEDMPECRWFEVWRSDESVDVITRMADAFTNAVADGFAARVAERWRGRREEL